MTAQIKGPAIFLAQFLSDPAPFDTLPNIVKWAADLGYKGVQIPANAGQISDLDRAAEGALFVAAHLIEATEKAFDDFAGGDRHEGQIRRMLGL